MTPASRIILFVTGALGLIVGLVNIGDHSAAGQLTALAGLYGLFAVPFALFYGWHRKEQKT